MALFVTVAPLDGTTETRTTLGFVDANAPEDVAPTGAPLKFWPGISRAPSLNREGWNGDFETGVFLPQSALNLNLNAVKSADSDAPAWRWTGAPIRIYQGNAGTAWGSLELVFDGLVLNATIADGTLRLTAQVDSEPFEEKCLTVNYTGDGLAGGVDDLKDRMKPACFGNAENVEPVAIDTTNFVYQVHGYGPIQAFRNIYERGITFGASEGDHASFVALVAADIPEGSWATCLAEGMFRLGAPPAGLITCDVSGDNTGGFHQSTAEIIRRWCEIVDVDPARLDDASLDAFETAVPYPISVYQTLPDKIIDAIAMLVLPCNAHVSLSWIGKLQVTRVAAIPAATIRLDAQGREKPPVLSCEEETVSAPFYRLEVQYARSWRVHSRDELVLDEDEAIVPKLIYKHYPEPPATPTGDDTPAGWYAFKPEMSRPVDLGDGRLLYGPVWMSQAQQKGGVTQEGGWSTPVMDDPRWRGFLIEGSVDSDDVLGGPNSLRILPDGISDTRWIASPIAGPWRLRWWVRDADTRAAVGVMFTDPADVVGLSWDDIHTGVLIAPQDATPFGLANPGIYPFANGDLDAGLADPLWNRMNAAVPSYSEYAMVSNGELIDLWVNRERVRTWVIDRTTLNEECWPVFYLEAWDQSYGPDTDIFEIDWLVGTPARILDFPIAVWSGALRRMKDEEGFEIYAPFMPNSTADAGTIEAEDFKGGGSMFFTVRNEIAGATGTTVIQLKTSSSNVGKLELDDDGEYRYYTGATVRKTGTWVDGDEWEMRYTGKKARLFRNGVLLRLKKVSKNQTVRPRFELTQGTKLFNIGIVPKNEDEYEYRGSVIATAFPLFNDASPQNPGGYTILGTSPDLAYSPTDTEDGDELRVTALFSYYWSSGSPAGTGTPYTPDAKVEVSEDDGATWADHPGTWDPSPSPGAVQGGAVQTITFTETASLVRTSAGEIRCRLVVDNTVAGTYTITPNANSFVQIEWLA